VAVDRYGGFRVILPGTGNLEQLDRLADGTIIAGGTSDGQVVAIDPTTGALTPLAPISGVYGVRVGPDQKIYVADWDAIYRIDPTTGLVETWLDNNAYNPKVLDFSHDLSKLYFGTISQSGNVYSVDLDANYDPVAPPVLLASTPGSWHDGLTVDICGNLYIAEYNNAAMYVVTPSGNVSTLFDAGGAGSSNYGHGVVFGTGANGWYEDAIYFPQPYNNDTVGEAIVGLPHRSYTGPVINQP
jgi:streptogramin lyase